MKHKANPKEKGYIFAFTLCIVSLISVLVLSSMQQMLLYQRAMNKQEQAHQYFYDLERIIHYLIALPEKERISCVQHQDSANEVLHQVLKKEGCALKTDKANYHYVIEDLGNYPCLMINDKTTIKATHHFRFTVAQDKPLQPSSIMQVRVIQPVPLLQCDSEVRYVDAGISSWRYLIG